jgi:16S rRNA (cytosine967-C5)-methyltransferase
VRETALQILSILSTGRGRARNILDRTIREQRLVDPDKSFLTELVYGTIRWRGNLDWMMGQFIPNSKLKKLQPEIVEILRLGLYQLFFLDSVPDHAAVNESVRLAKKHGYDGVSGLVNAVLRRAIRDRSRISYPDVQSDPVGHTSARYSHPKWMVRRWIERYGVNETIQLCSANNLRAPLYIRTNILKTSRDHLINSLQEDGATATASCNLSESINAIELPSSINKLSSYRLGWFQVQDESSMLASHILDPRPGDIVIDACAAPGGKTTHIAELMQNRGKILAFDTDARRLPLVLKSCQRLGITIVKALEADTRNLDNRLPVEKADRVIVDAPCTGLGVLRRNVEARWRRTPDQLGKFPELQYAILASAARHVKPGGVLVYCTCTIEPEENQQVVARFLSTHSQFQAESVLPFLPAELRVKCLVTEEGYMQTYPHLHDMDGFFAARMVNGLIGK